MIFNERVDLMQGVVGSSLLGGAHPALDLGKACSIEFRSSEYGG